MVAGRTGSRAVHRELAAEKNAIYADNAGVARYLQRTIETLLHKPFADESLPIIDAKFERSGNSLSTVEERIVSRKDEIILTWWDFMAPFVLTMAPGAMNRPLGVYSTFIPARGAQLSVNGEAAAGKVFPQERGGRPRRAACSPGRRPGRDSRAVALKRSALLSRLCQDSRFELSGRIRA